MFSRSIYLIFETFQHRRYDVERVPAKTSPCTSHFHILLVTCVYGSAFCKDNTMLAKLPIHAPRQASTQNSAHSVEEGQIFIKDIYENICCKPTPFKMKIVLRENFYHCRIQKFSFEIFFQNFIDLLYQMKQSKYCLATIFTVFPLI